MLRSELHCQKKVEGFFSFYIESCVVGGGVARGGVGGRAETAGGTQGCGTVAASRRGEPLSLL